MNSKSISTAMTTDQNAKMISLVMKKISFQNFKPITIDLIPKEGEPLRTDLKQKLL